MNVVHLSRWGIVMSIWRDFLAKIPESTFMQRFPGDRLARARAVAGSRLLEKPFGSHFQPGSNVTSQDHQLSVDFSAERDKMHLTELCGLRLPVESVFHYGP